MERSGIANNQEGMQGLRAVGLASATAARTMFLPRTTTAAAQARLWLILGDVTAARGGPTAPQI
jgi:hypothetical protein